jgi:glycosyltransferase involved in cell wall biosynthesis
MRVVKLGISVVTVTYNDLDHLMWTVRSVQAQQGVTLQHIVIDGASTDGTPAWLAEAATHALVVSEPDEGLFDAMNKGLRLADREVITFLNAGDVYLRKTVLRDVLQSYRPVGWTWAYGLARVVDERGRAVRPVVGMRRYRFRAHAWRLNPINHQATYVRTDVLRDIGGFSTRFGNAADFHALLRLGAMSAPNVLRTMDVRYLAGGVSERQGRSQLKLKHLARVDVLGHGPYGTFVDRVFTGIQIGYLHCRRAVKRTAMALHWDRALDWWAARGEPTGDAVSGSSRRHG